jgi:hypothetical protein
MGYLDKLKVVTAEKPANLPPLLQRRNNLMNKLDWQYECVKAKLEGRDYYVPIWKITVNELGERTRIEQQRRVKSWWYKNADGKLVFEMRYANKKVELQKGKTGVEVESLDTLLLAIELLKKAVESGELDTSLSTTAKTIRAELAK